MRMGLFRLVLTGLVFFNIAGRLSAELVPGPEFQAHVYTLSQQRFPAVALDADFDFVVVWQSFGRDGDNEGVFARRFDSAGVAIGLDFQVNSNTIVSQASPAVALAGEGSFVIAWTSYNQDGSGAGVFAKRFNSSGVAQALEFQVNKYTLGSQGGAVTPPGNAGPAIAAELNGDFVVVWQDLQQEGVGAGGGIFGRRFDAAGNGVGDEFHVNTTSVSAQTYPSVAVDNDGNFVVVWQSLDQDGGQSGIFAQRFAANGASVAGEFQVNLRTLLSQRYPDVSLDSNGDFVVAWQSYGQDSDSYGIFSRRFASNGVGEGVEFIVNTYTTSSQRFPTVGVDGDGDFVVAWQSFNQDGDDQGVFARTFNSVGVPISVDFRVNSYTDSNQVYAAVGINALGDFVVTWQSYGQDLSQNGIFARRFDNFSVLDVDASGQVTALSDGIVILRFLFGFEGATLIAGAIDEDDCSRCEADRIEEYLQSLL